MTGRSRDRSRDWQRLEQSAFGKPRMNPPKPLPETISRKAKMTRSEEIGSGIALGSEQSPEQILSLAVEAGKEAVSGTPNTFTDSDIVFPEQRRDSVL